MTAQQAENNLARTAVQALSAILGGAQSLHVNSYDEALALPSEESARMALRTQQILAKESGVAQTVDPFAGSYYVESLTTAIEQEVWHYLERIDALGGMVAAIERGWVQREIEDAAYQQQRAVDSGETVVVGVNRFATPAKSPRSVRAGVAKRVEREQIERVRALRARRDPLRWQAAVDQVTEQARSSDNLMPAILEAVESYATVGEIAESLRKVFGEHRPIRLERSATEGFYSVRSAVKGSILAARTAGTPLAASATTTTPTRPVDSSPHPTASRHTGTTSTPVPPASPAEHPSSLPPPSAAGCLQDHPHYLFPPGAHSHAHTDLCRTRIHPIRQRAV